MWCEGYSRPLCAKSAHSNVPPIIFVALSVCVVVVLLLLGACTWYVYRAFVPARRQRALGVLLILLVVFLWTASSVAVQLVFEAGRYRKPFFLTYLSTGLLVVYLPFYPRRVARLCALCIPARYLPWSTASPCGRGGARSRGQYDLLSAGKPDSAAGAQEPSQWSPGPATELLLAAKLGTIFFLYQLCYNIGLELSSVSTVTVIATSSGLWTLLFSAIRLGEHVGPIKLTSTLLTFCGVLLVVAAAGAGEDDGDDMLEALFTLDHRRLLARLLGGGGGNGGHRPSSGHAGFGNGGGGGSSESAYSGGHGAGFGNGVTLLSALLYGAYAAQLKYDVPSEDSIPMHYLFGLFGLVTIALAAPCVAILHFVRLERFAPPTEGTLLALVLNGLLGSVLSNMLLARAMLLASPLVATVGLSLSIPLAMGADGLRGRGHFGQTALLGTAAVWVGFVGVSLAESLEKRWRCRQVCGGTGIAPEPDSPEAGRHERSAP